MKYAKDFAAFTRGSDEPPAEVSKRLLQQVHARMTPSFLKLLPKILILHLLSAVLSLSICEQFGFRLIGEGPGLMGTFASLGTYGCMAACGFVFLGLSLLLCGLFLEFEDLSFLRKRRFAVVGVLSFASLLSFLAGQGFVVIGSALAWGAGSMLGGLAILEAASWLRLRLHIKRMH